MLSLEKFFRSECIMQAVSTWRSANSKLETSSEAKADAGVDCTTTGCYFH
jgi:hypothetical protein